MSLSLVLLVQAQNVYPQLLFGRLLFSLGGAAVSTMVTAVLPAVTQNGPSQRVERVTSSADNPQEESSEAGGSPSSRLAGFVGTCAGCGALVSLAVFLPLPARLEKAGVGAPRAVQYSYYFVAGVALIVCAWCFFGLRNLSGEEDKGWYSLIPPSSDLVAGSVSSSEEAPVDRSVWPSKMGASSLPYRRQISTAIGLGFRNGDICLGYVGGFVARASSVGISLFIPLSVNHFYRSSGLCHGDNSSDDADAPGSSLGDIKRSCPQAYILASILTGVSQLVALLVAHAFGFLSVKRRRFHLPLLFAALAGIAGYTWFALLPDPRFKEGNAGVSAVMALIGISHIGAIVCSLAVLSNGILTVNNRMDMDGSGISPINNNQPTHQSENSEQRPLLGNSCQAKELQKLSHLKGSIAGVYSLYGGAGILLLTKLGGLLFDTVSPRIPFYLMTGFNGILLLMGVLCGLVRSNK